MLYEVYHKCKERQLEAYRIYCDLLGEKEQIFMLSQPKSVKYGEITHATGSRNKFDDYLVAKEKTRIDERLNEAELMVSAGDDMAKRAEMSLRSSADKYDKVYVMYYLERYSVAMIAGKIGYSRSHIFRILSGIECTLNKSIQ